MAHLRRPSQPRAALARSFLSRPHAGSFVASMGSAGSTYPSYRRTWGWQKGREWTQDARDVAGPVALALSPHRTFALLGF